MVRKRVEVWEPRRVAKASRLGFAVLLLTTLTSAWAQQRTAAPPVQSVVASKATSTPVAPSDVSKTPGSEYTVSPEDVLDVNVLDVPEVTRTYRVSSNGFLTMPLLPEPIPAAGETLDQLSHLIATKFHDAGMLNNAVVTVSLRETRLHAVLVSGAVTRPQAYAIYGPTRLLDILVQAGGLTESAGNDAIILRGDIGARADLAESARSGAGNPPAKEQSFTLNIRKLVETGDDKTNILLYPGDRVTVQRAELIYIMGAVGRPGGYVLSEARQQITVLKALALAGDVSGFAKKSRITILRHSPGTPEDTREQIPVDYKAMVKGQIADIRLKPDDILYVPVSAGRQALNTGINSTINAVTGASGALLIYH
jgi:polysaccharide export outer membrane protein